MGAPCVRVAGASGADGALPHLCTLDLSHSNIDDDEARTLLDPRAGDVTVPEDSAHIESLLAIAEKGDNYGMLKEVPLPASITTCARRSAATSRARPERREALGREPRRDRGAPGRGDPRPISCSSVHSWWSGRP